VHVLLLLPQEVGRDRVERVGGELVVALDGGEEIELDGGRREGGGGSFFGKEEEGEGERKNVSTPDEKKRAKERKKNSLSPPSLSLSPLLSHLHPPLDRDLLHVPRPVRLAAEGRVPHPDARALAPPEEREVGDLEGHRAVEEVREVEVGRVVADDDIRVRLDDEVPVFFVLFFVFFVSFFFSGERKKRREEREER
jgi:hypothetical protein